MTDRIEDNELLYRCVFHGRDCYKIEGNTVRISSQAFADKKLAPSVDRSQLCGHDPSHTQKDCRDGVVSLITHDVRLIDTVIQRDDKGKAVCTYKIDVYPDPKQENIAHAEIRQLQNTQINQFLENFWSA